MKKINKLYKIIIILVLASITTTNIVKSKKNKNVDLVTPVVKLNLIMEGYSDYPKNLIIAYMPGCSLYTEKDANLQPHEQNWLGQISTTTAGKKTTISKSINASTYELTGYYFIYFYITDPAFHGYFGDITMLTGSSVYAFRYNQSLPKAVDINCYFWGSTVYPYGRVFVHQSF